ncbi:hypothetical protein TIFTF001_005976 [Ficus carica]|uniref:Uncharacterized protein n=1 Tax=Ficus carica TaxID=3494 RepID=A0AA87ZN71_FICCA|nr:hypothetical protein TIFTF001_005976 [Ficus carica]
MLMSKTSGTIPNVIARTRLALHGCSASSHLQKEKHLEVIRTTVGCLSRAFLTDSGVWVTQSSRLPSVLGGQINFRHIKAIGCGWSVVIGFTLDVRWWMAVQSSHVISGYTADLGEVVNYDRVA